MKPITHPLAIAYVEAFIRGTADELSSAGRSWRDAGYPLYAEPTPMPAPALGMRVWFEHTQPSGDTVTYSKDMRDASPGEQWGANVNEIVIITDFRTREVLWRRS